MFDGTLRKWNIDLVEFELIEDENPICLRLYPVPKAHKENLKEEVERLVLLAILEVAND